MNVRKTAHASRAAILADTELLVTRAAATVRTRIVTKTMAHACLAVRTGIMVINVMLSAHRSVLLVIKQLETAQVAPRPFMDCRTALCHVAATVFNKALSAHVERLTACVYMVALMVTMATSVTNHVDVVPAGTVSDLMVHVVNARMVLLAPTVLRVALAAVPSAGVPRGASVTKTTNTARMGVITVSMEMSVTGSVARTAKTRSVTELAGLAHRAVTLGIMEHTAQKRAPTVWMGSVTRLMGFVRTVV